MKFSLLAVAGAQIGRELWKEEELRRGEKDVLRLGVSEFIKIHNLCKIFI